MKTETHHAKTWDRAKVVLNWEVYSNKSLLTKKRKRSNKQPNDAY
jgi:hypothetical protein